MGKSFADALEAAERVSTKEAKLSAIAGIVPAERRLISEAFNPYRRFNVKKFDKPGKYAEKDGYIEDFYSLLDDLAKRHLTGDAARDAVTATLSRFTARTAKYLVRVLKHDLDCGAQRITFEKVYPDLNIPEFELMKAKKMSDRYIWHFPILAEDKYDGHRLVSFVQKGVVEYCSSNGKPSFCNGLFDEELLRMAEYFGGGMVFDGEVLGSSFQNTSKAKGAKNGGHRKELRYYVFDQMPIDQWNDRSAVDTQIDRTTDLCRCVKEVKPVLVIKSAGKVCNSNAEVDAYYREVLDNGLEGLIVKKLAGKYAWDRVEDWCKLKPVHTYDLEIIEVKRGKDRFSNTCGSLACKGEDENGTRIRVDVSGITDKMRDWFWSHRSTIGGTIVEVKADRLTEDPDDDGVYSLRFPRFKKIRDDK